MSYDRRPQLGVAPPGQPVGRSFAKGKSLDQGSHLAKLVDVMQ
jgi:hypothetical protein